MFRRLYWVSEQVYSDGTSSVNGVYTSIPDLVHYGLRFPEQGQLRLTLTKLDSNKEPLGCWLSPNFEGLEAAMMPYLKTEEFSSEHVRLLITSLVGTNVAA
ncbi:MAG: hypothetical protein GC165_08420 [Armatimonadetes bacterium]|nr:hypothetical protein [Armatimonadota bacterium]